MWTVNIVYPEVLADARRMLQASLAGPMCRECDADDGEDQAGDDVRDAAHGSSSSDAAILDEPAPDDDSVHGDGDGDDVHADAVNASLEQNVLAPLRRVHGVARVPTGLLTRQQAWSLAHASDFVASTAEEMVDPWD